MAMPIVVESTERTPAVTLNKRGNQLLLFSVKGVERRPKQDLKRHNYVFPESDLVKLERYSSIISNFPNIEQIEFVRKEYAAS